MTRTNARTQQIIGLIFSELEGIAGNLDSWAPATVDDRSWDELRNDRDYIKAQDIVLSILRKEMSKNANRGIGADAYSLNDLEVVA